MNCKVVGKEHPKCKTTSAEANPIFLEVKSPGTRDLNGRQNTGLGTCSRRFVKPHSPDVDVSSGKCRWRQALRPRSVALLWVTRKRRCFHSSCLVLAVVTITVHGGCVSEIAPRIL